ncbi:MAG: hypothetical protein JNM20_01135 [Rhizobiales bacterium]|nr:hypothetical protein [Hyphomicrobiales bacterium]
MKRLTPLLSFAALGLMLTSTPAAAAARCPPYLLKSSIKELCWEGAWRPYERDDWRDYKYNKDKYKPGNPNGNKPKWRFKSGQGGGMSNDS